jgi:hypothetical protein
LVVTRHRRALRQELGVLRLTQLMSEAEARGVAAHEIEDAEDSEDSKAALIGLILLRAKTAAPGRDRSRAGGGGQR